MLLFEKVGIRKSIFSDNEKVVTDAVILKREQMSNEAAENQLTENALNNGSTSQLHTGKYKFNKKGNKHH